MSLTKALAIGAVPILLLFGAAFQSSNSVPGQLQAIQSQLSNLLAQNSALVAKVDSLVNKGPRKFYVTNSDHQGDTALSACAQGYHMASIWELHDPTDLRYNKDLGVTFDDSGFGPPVPLEGWIRTGNEARVANLTSRCNCKAWMQADAASFGTVAFLDELWGSPFPALRTTPWVAETTPCNSSRKVWCVQD